MFSFKANLEMKKHQFNFELLSVLCWKPFPVNDLRATMLAKAILVHGDIGYKFCWLLLSEDQNEGTLAGHGITRHDVTKSDLTVPPLFLLCIDIHLNIQLIFLTLYMTQGALGVAQNIQVMDSL